MQAPGLSIKKLTACTDDFENVAEAAVAKMSLLALITLATVNVRLDVSLKLQYV